MSNVEATTSNPPDPEERPPPVPLAQIAAFPDISPVAHEFAALLEVVTSYELVNWLAKRLQFAADQLV